ncbi:MAG: hypothetical protein M3389_05760 [Actinomycetota bacterium]|nr:hypothetical protein [Actinomycetota bacterium]
MGVALPLATKVTLAGEGVTGSHGDAVWIGEAMARLGRLLAVLGDAAPQLAGLVFGASVTFEFTPSDEELEHAESAHRAAQQRGTSAEDDETRRLLMRAVPDTTVGGAMAGELLESALADPVETALEYGTGVTQAYSSLAAHLATREDAQVELVAPGRGDRVVVTSRDSKRIRRELRDLGERQPTTIRAFGVLSLADATKRRFGLRLDREVVRHPILRGRSVVSGEYAPEVGDKLRDAGLWNTEIRAVLRVEYNPGGGTSTVRPASFTLIDAEPRYR